MILTYRQEALDDVIRQTRYYLVEVGRPDLVEAFQAALAASAKMIFRYPEIGVRYPLRNRGLQGLRSWPVNGFRELRIYYLREEDAIRVIRILHGKRHIRKVLERQPLV